MRFGQVGLVSLGIFVALACGSTDDESKVNGGGSAAQGNINTNNNAGSGSFNPGTGSTTGNPGAGSGSTGTPGTGADCAGLSADGEPSPVDLFFMVDITLSMNCPVPDAANCVGPSEPPATGESRWTLVSKALKAFVADPKNQALGVGMGFFPVTMSRGGGGMMGGGNANISCTAADYAKPVVAIGPLSTTAQPLSAAITNQTPVGTTPTVPSLTGAIDYAKVWAGQNPTHKVAVVYATDGQPNGCNNNTVDRAATVARAGAMAGIPTYVLGVGPNLANLDAIAVGGGTTKAFLVDTSQDAAAQLSAALASIAESSLVCTYTIPAPPKGQTFVDGQVNIEYTNGAGTVTTIGPTAMGADCATAPGWQYSMDKKQINLCGKSCTDVKADKGGKLQVRFGCPTAPVEVPK